MRCAALALALVLASGAAAADVESPSIYLYQHAYFASPGWASVESETAYGTREASLHGTESWEEVLRVRAAAADWLAFEVAGGGLFLSPNRATIRGLEDEAGLGPRERDVLYGFSADAHFKALRQDRSGVDLGIGLGYHYDYEGTSIPRLRLTLGRSWGKVNLMASGLVEYPLGAKEVEIEKEAEAGGGTEVEVDRERAYDAVDLILSAGASYAVADAVRVGVESAVEDIEGFWDDTEAEGGAKLIAGPTASGAFFDRRLHVRANAGLLVPVTYNEPTRVPDGAYQNRVGFVGRVALGVNF